MEDAEKELIEGIANCYNTCHGDFKNTVRMVARARGLSESEVLSMLDKIKATYENSKEYAAIKSRLPADFPL